MSAVESIISSNSEADIGISLEKTTGPPGSLISDDHREQSEGLFGRILFTVNPIFHYTATSKLSFALMWN